VKIAVYSIARNEVSEVAGWEATTREADYRLLLDTGSSDGTDTAIAQYSDVVMYRGNVSPWRFDDARNAALCLLPADIDICVALDMDERLRGAGCASGVGWRDAILASWTPDTTMLRCPILSGGVTYYSYRIHARSGYRWTNPVHEILRWRGQGEPVDTLTERLFIDHLPQTAKPRPPHRSMLEEAVAESPGDARVALQYGWQLLVEGNIDKGIAELYRFLDLSPKTGVEAAFIHRLISAHDPDQFLTHIEHAEAAFPATSNQVALAEYYRGKEQWQACYTACQAAIARERMRPATVGHWGDDARITTSWLHDTASTAAFMTWDFEAAYGHAVEALRRAPDDAHRQNVAAIAKHVAAGATNEHLLGKSPIEVPKLSLHITRGNAELSSTDEGTDTNLPQQMNAAQ
jgi:hypothetical protein